MTARSFVVGVVVGGLLIAGPVFLLDADGEPRPTRQLREASPAADEHSDSRDLLEELARLRAQLDEARRLADRVPVEADFRPAQGRAAADAASESVAVEAVAPDLRLVAMLEELRGMLNSGALAARFADRHAELAEFLIGIWMETGEPERAFDLIDHCGLRLELGSFGTWIGEQLLENGHRDRARDAFLMALEHHPTDWDLLGELADLDPELALREHTRLAVEGGTPTDDSSFRAQQALLMLASGRHDDALTLIDALIASGEMPDILWQNLVRRDPVAAEDRLRARIDHAATEVDHSEIRLQIASSLRHQGRAAEARRELGSPKRALAAVRLQP